VELGTLASEALARHPVDPHLANVSPDTDPPPRVLAAKLRAAEAREARQTEISSTRGGTPWAQPEPSPVSAYAPLRRDGGTIAISSGRGLY
jgi:hypothetical protein